MKKTYIGKRLKPPYNGPRSRSVANQAKRPERELTHKEMLRVRQLLRKCTSLPQLQALADRLAGYLGEARRNADLPAVIEETIWTGSVVQELVACGKANCGKCKGGPSHGPYWYHYGDGLR